MTYFTKLKGKYRWGHHLGVESTHTLLQVIFRNGKFGMAASAHPEIACLRNELMLIAAQLADIDHCNEIVRYKG